MTRFEGLPTRNEPIMRSTSVCRPFELVYFVRVSDRDQPPSPS